MLKDLVEGLRNTSMTTADKDLYAVAAGELKEGRIDSGLWAKAFAEADGDEQKTQAMYLRLRVRELVEELTAIHLEKEARARAIQQEEMASKVAEAKTSAANLGLLIFWMVVVCGLVASLLSMIGG